MSRHAYCIIAHKDLYTLNKLLELLDDARNDIFLFIDKNWNLSMQSIYQPVDSQLITIPAHQRHKIYWGDVSLVEAELKLLECAVNHSFYEHIHLISGQDLPLHSQDYIHDFFNNHKGINFIGFAQGESNYKLLHDRMSYHVLRTKYYRSQNKHTAYLANFLRILVVGLQKRLKIKRSYPGIELKKGCEWVSITWSFANLLVGNKEKISRTFKTTFCGDEIYKQTIAWNSSFKNTLYITTDEYSGCLREIDWDRGNPYTYRIEDLDNLLNSTKLIAGKFDSEIDKDIIVSIFNALKRKRTSNN